MAEFNFLNNEDTDGENHLIPEFFRSQNENNNNDFYNEFCKNVFNDDNFPLFDDSLCSNIKDQDVLSDDDKEDFQERRDAAETFFQNKESVLSNSLNENCWFFNESIIDTDIFDALSLTEPRIDYYPINPLKNDNFFNRNNKNQFFFNNSIKKQQINLFDNKENFVFENNLNKEFKTEMCTDHLRKPINKRKIVYDPIDELSKSIVECKISNEEVPGPDQYNKNYLNNNFYNVSCATVPTIDSKTLNLLDNYNDNLNRNNEKSFLYNKTMSKKQKLDNCGKINIQEMLDLKQNKCYDRIESRIFSESRKLINRTNNNSNAIDMLLDQFDDINVNKEIIENEDSDASLEYLDDDYNNSVKEQIMSPTILSYDDFIKYSERQSDDIHLNGDYKKRQNDNELREPLCKPCQILQNYNQQKSESTIPLSVETTKREKKLKYNEDNVEKLYEKFCSLSASKKKKINPQLTETNNNFLMKKCSTPYKNVKAASANNTNQIPFLEKQENVTIDIKVNCEAVNNDLLLSTSPPAITSQEISKYQILLTQNISFNKNSESGKISPELFSQINNEEILINKKNDSDMDLCESINLFTPHIDVNENNKCSEDCKSPELFTPMVKQNSVSDQSYKNNTTSLSVCDYAPYYCEAVLRQHHDSDYINITAKTICNESAKYEYFTDDQYNDITENRRKILITKIEVIILSLIRDIKKQNDLCLYIRKSTWDDCDLSTEKLPTQHFKHNIQLREINYYSARSVNKFPLMIHLLSEIYVNLKNNTICTRRELYYKNLQFVKCQRTIDNSLRDLCSLLESPSWELRIFNTIKGLIAGPLILHTFNDELINCMNLNGGCILPKDINIIKKIVTSAKYVIVVEKDTVFQKLLNKYFFNYLNNECILITGKGYPDTITRLMLQRLKNELHLPIYALMDADPHGIEIMFTYRYGSLSLHENVTALAVPDIHWLGVYPSEINLLNLTRIKLTTMEMNKLKFMQKRPYITKKIYKELEILITTNEKAEIESLSTELISYIGRKIKMKLL